MVIYRNLTLKMESPKVRLGNIFTVELVSEQPLKITFKVDY